MLMTQALCYCCRISGRGGPANIFRYNNVSDRVIAVHTSRDLQSSGNNNCSSRAVAIQQARQSGGIRVAGPFKKGALLAVVIVHVVVVGGRVR